MFAAFSTALYFSGGVPGMALTAAVSTVTASASAVTAVVTSVLTVSASLRVAAASADDAGPSTPRPTAPTGATSGYAPNRNRVRTRSRSRSGSRSTRPRRFASGPTT